MVILLENEAWRGLNINKDPGKAEKFESSIGRHDGWRQSTLLNFLNFDKEPHNLRITIL